MVFLKRKIIRTSNVETGLHILSTESIKLKNTYEYIETNYGDRYLYVNTSILSVKLHRIKELEEKLKKIIKKVDKIMQVCYNGYVIFCEYIVRRSI